MLKGNHHINSVSTEIDEVEPNNSLDHPQVLSGYDPLIVYGIAEAADSREISVAGSRLQSDDIEDLYLITITAPGLTITLGDYYSDCDLYLLPQGRMFPIAMSAAPGDTMNEVNLVLIQSNLL